MKKLRSLLFAALLSIGSLPLCAQQLFVGANYHPHDDKNPEKIARDIRLMQEAGFNVIRLGHLAWDSFGRTLHPARPGSAPLGHGAGH